ncbi:MAG: acyltransferase family protein [Bdellovibrionales bacterium]|nr:acyltransferase family protein [Bdellovibrionales bacterium]
MKNFLQKPKEKMDQLIKLGSDALLYQRISRSLMDLMGSYFRIRVEGMENIPLDSGAVIIPNHSGYAGLDAMILANEIYKATRRPARVLTHRFWFFSHVTSKPANLLGFIKASTQNGVKYLNKDQLVVLFPEGEQGNFKPTIRAYRLQEFKRGFVRMALLTGRPIVPTVIIGAEESHINLKTLKLDKIFGKNTILPLPLNVIPLPAKWKIKVLKPIYLPFKPDAVNDSELVHSIAQDIQEKMQDAIYAELKNRTHIF